MYRLVDAVQVAQPKGLHYRLTFAPVIPETRRDLHPDQRVVTVPEARYAVIREHGRNFAAEEIDAMEP